MRTAKAVRIRVGQIWESLDRREAGRRFEILDITGYPGYILVQTLGVGGRQTRIRLDRFRPGSTSYRLVSE